MEVACGEYGDMVPPLVVAVQNNHCALYQCPLKLTNCDKTVRRTDHNTLQHPDDTRGPAADGGGDGENIDDVDGTHCGMALLSNSCQRRAVPTLVLTNGDVSCDVTLLQEVSKLSN